MTTRKYQVEVVRTSYAFRTMFVEAASKEEARDIALDTAGNFEFSEKDADYSVDYVVEVPPKT